jgi:FtsH-binding integral membrane protein
MRDREVGRPGRLISYPRVATRSIRGSIMAEFNRNLAGVPFGGPVSSAEAAAIDAGLRAYMLRIYNYMVLGLVITGIAALGIYMLSVTDDVAAAAKAVRGGAEVPARLAGNMYLTPLGYAVFVSPLKWVVFLSPLALVFGLSFGIERLRPAAAQLLFWIFAALIGVSLGSIFMVYTHTSVVRVFFITAASFGALSLWGYTTKRDLTGMGSFLIMGLFGIVIAGLVNMFLASSAMQWIISVVGVFVFAGLTAWDTQRLKNEYIYGAMDGDTAERTAIMGALSLYLDVVNLFTLLLQLLGQRED